MARAAASAAGKPTIPPRSPDRDGATSCCACGEQIGTDNISMIAAGVAFYGLLAIFPAITAFVSIWGLIADPAQVQQQFAAVREIVPAEAWELLDEQLRSVAASQRRRASAGASRSGSSWRCGARAPACAP